MKIVAIGDIHGKLVWIQAFKENKGADKYIFLGDYVDGLFIADEKTYNNLHEIIEIKKLLGDQVILLLGNRDLQYIYYPKYRCSGFRAVAQPDLSNLFRDNRQLFQVAYQYKSYLFTHAGISSKWFHVHQEKLLEAGLDESTDNLGEILNQLNQGTTRDFLHEVSMYRGGVNNWGGITWADKKETMANPLPGLHQVVGHSRVKEIIKADYGDIIPDTSITYIDCLDTRTDFFKLEIE